MIGLFKNKGIPLNACGAFKVLLAVAEVFTPSTFLQSESLTKLE
jgi:hypothetical protein